MATAAVRSVSPQTLAAWIRRRDLALQVIDVRDDDFVGGCIIGARNIPSECFYEADHVRYLVKELSRAERIVVHCMYSQMRGPRCAATLAQAFEKTAERPDIYVLEGGYAGWSEFVFRERAAGEQVDDLLGKSAEG